MYWQSFQLGALFPLNCDAQIKWGALQFEVARSTWVRPSTTSAGGPKPIPPEARTERRASMVTEAADLINMTFRKVGGPLESEIGVFQLDIKNYVFAASSRPRPTGRQPSEVSRM